MAAPSFSDLLTSAVQAEAEHRDVMVSLDRAVAKQVDALDERIAQLEDEHARREAEFQQRRDEAARDARLADPRPAEIEAEAEQVLADLTGKIDALVEERERLSAGSLVTFRFSQLPGDRWADVAGRFPPRVDVSIDRAYGYNYHEAAKAAAPLSGVIVQGSGVDGDDTVTLEKPTDEQWATVWTILSGGDFERIAESIWALNDAGPRQRVLNAKKVSRAGSAITSN